MCGSVRTPRSQASIYETDYSFDQPYNVRSLRIMLKRHKEHSHGIFAQKRGDHAA